MSLIDLLEYMVFLHHYHIWGHGILGGIDLG